MLRQSVQIVLVADELDLLEPAFNERDVLPDLLIGDEELTGLLLDDARDDVYIL